jgi:hypothetical protein
VPEGIYGYRKEYGIWPLWDDAVTYLSESEEVSAYADPLAEAERRLLRAIKDCEVRPTIYRDRYWRIELTEETVARLDRRLLNVRLYRREIT